MDSAELGDSDAVGLIYKLDQELGAHRFALTWLLLVWLKHTLTEWTQHFYFILDVIQTIKSVFSAKICRGQLKPDRSGGDTAKLASDRASFKIYIQG